MDLDREFDLRITEIHELDRHRGDVQISGDENPMDIRRAELNAMTDVFLGANYDPAKRSQIEILQNDGHRKQAELAHRFALGQMDPDDFLSATQVLIAETFGKCEEVVGPEDFCKLFGASRIELVQLIDPAAFLQAARKTSVNDLTSGAGQMLPSTQEY